MLISGVMADVAASANDPIFLNHHAMVDCIFETWLQKNPNARYPIAMDDNSIPPGYKYHDYIVPFFPIALYKHSDMFTTADKFGYNCIIKSESHISNCDRRCIIGIIYGILILCAVCTTCMIIGCCIHRLRKNHARQILNPPVHLMCKLVLSMALPTLPYSYEKK